MNILGFLHETPAQKYARLTAKYPSLPLYSSSEAGVYHMLNDKDTYIPSFNYFKDLITLHDLEHDAAKKRLYKLQIQNQYKSLFHPPLLYGRDSTELLNEAKANPIDYRHNLTRYFQNETAITEDEAKTMLKDSGIGMPTHSRDVKYITHKKGSSYSKTRSKYHRSIKYKSPLRGGKKNRRKTRRGK
jgi:hypothetical protein